MSSSFATHRRQELGPKPDLAQPLFRSQPPDAFVEFAREDLEQSIPSRFETQVSQNRDRCAIKSKRYSLSYDGLDRLANQIAQAVLSIRGASEEPVVVVAENDAPMIAALLGLLKAGKMYVPVDSSMPLEKIRYILDDSDAGLLLTDTRNQELAAQLTDRKDVSVLNFETLDSHMPHDRPNLSISPDRRCWILYTSGSTGQPKGVVQTHRNIIHYVRVYTNGLYLNPKDRFSLFMPLFFNGANHEIFSALLNGASLYPYDVKVEGIHDLLAWIRENELTIYCSVPTFFRHFTACLPPDTRLPTIRLTKLVGEPVYRTDFEAFKRHFADDTVLVNRLGSTELGTIRWNFLTKGSVIEGDLVPVGHAVEDNEVLLLDGNEKEVAAGEIGEIAVRTRYASPGYWKRPAQTAAVFRPDPAGGNQRIYLTGDLGRLTPDGSIVHHGRKDFQAKIRGHRVELVEVELALIDLGLAKEATVMALADESGEQRLVAYIVPPKQQPPSVTTLRQELGKKLSDYKIPAFFVMLEAMPLTDTGKINRRALPSPGKARPSLDVPFVEPRNEVETTVARIWSGILGMGELGVLDNFFDLGGDSLRGAQIVVRLREAFHMDLTLATLFEAPTVAELATLIEHFESQHN